MRKCSYCRVEGHQRKVCPTMHNQRAWLYDNTVRIRKNMHKCIVDAGYSTGALILMKNHGGLSTCIIGDIANVVGTWDFNNAYMIRHTRAVRYNEGIHLDHKMFYMPLINMTKGGTYEEYSFDYEQLSGGRTDAGYYFRSIKLLEPMHDMYELPDDVYGKNIKMHRRLECGEPNPYRSDLMPIEDRFTRRDLVTLPLTGDWNP